MARTPNPTLRDGDAATETATQAPAEASVTATETAPASPQTDAQPPTTESGEQGTATPAPQQPAEAAKVEKSDDLTAWQAAVDAAYEVADEATGTVPEANMAAVSKEYRNLSSKGRGEARRKLNDAMRTFVQEREIPKAQAAVKMSDQMTAGTASKATRAPAEPTDPTEAFVNRAVTYDLAKTLAIQTVPEGVKDDWSASAKKLRDELAPQVAAYQEWLTARSSVKEGEDAPAKPEAISPVVEAAFKLAQGRAAGVPKVRTAAAASRASFDGPKRSVKAHIREALAKVPVGDFLKVAEIVKFNSNEYGEDHPSSGAVSAALNSKNAIEGVETGTKDGHFGAYRTA